MNSWKIRVWWALGGSLLGLGTVTIFSVGILLVVAGVAFVLYATTRRPWPREGPWIALAALGLAPACLLVYGYAASDPTANSFPEGYWLVVLPFVMLSLLGIAGTVITLRRGLPS